MQWGLTPSEHLSKSLTPPQGNSGPLHQPAYGTRPSGEQHAASPPGRQRLPLAPEPRGAPSTGWAVPSFLQCPTPSFCPSGEWEKELVPSLALRDLGRRQGTASLTPPHDADDPSPPRTVSHDLFLGSYVTREPNLGSTGSTTIQTVFPHAQAGEDSHLAIFAVPHVTQAHTHHVIVKSHGPGVRKRPGTGQAAPLPSARP